MKKPKRPKPACTAAATIFERCRSARFASKAKELVGDRHIVLKLVSAIGAALGLISVEPTAAAEPSNPFSGYYKITNEQGVAASIRQLPIFIQPR